MTDSSNAGQIKRIEYGVNLTGYIGFAGTLSLTASQLSEGETVELNALVQHSGILGMNGHHVGLPGLGMRSISIETTDGKRCENTFDGVAYAGPFAKLKGLFDWLERHIRDEEKLRKEEAKQRKLQADRAKWVE